MIHGAYSAQDRWWRPAADGAPPTFADRLEASLAERGMAGTVWAPALAAGFDTTSFSWSGANRHSARKDGAKKLVAALQALAARSGASREDPLEVFIVGHSHGGNVALEMLRRLPDGGTVRARRLVLLATPLIEFRPALRPFRFAIALAMFAVVFGALGVAALLPRLLPGLLAVHPWVSRVLVLAAFIFYRWVFTAVAWLGDMVWAVVGLPFRAARGRAAGQVYGPEPATLLARLGGHRVALVTSHQDEADLLLQLSAAPRRLYREWVRERYGRFGRTVEWLLVRPIVEGLLLRVMETVLERLMFGFDWLRVLLFDHDLADLDTSRAYPATVFERLDVTQELLRATATGTDFEPFPEPPVRRVEAAGLRGPDRRLASFRERLRSALAHLLAQIHPRHSDYYQTPAVLNRIADALVAR